MPWIACKPFGDIHSICPQANTPILVISLNKIDDIVILPTPHPHAPMTSGKNMITIKTIGLLLPNFVHAL